MVEMPGPAETSNAKARARYLAQSEIHKAAGSEVKRLVDTDGENVGYEGNGLIKVKGTYFLTGAEWNGPLRTDGTYDMMYGTSKSLMGPYSKRRLAVPHGGHGTAFRDAQGHFWYTLFGNDTTAPWRRHFGLVPIEVSEDGIRVPQIER